MTANTAEICPGDGKPCYVGGRDDKRHRCGTVQCGRPQVANTAERVSDKLKPCPFCGGEAVIRNIAGGGNVITCAQCGAESAVFDNALLALPAWNRRSEGAGEREEVIEECAKVADDAHRAATAMLAEVEAYSDDYFRTRGAESAGRLIAMRIRALTTPSPSVPSPRVPCPHCRDTGYITNPAADAGSVDWDEPCPRCNKQEADEPSVPSGREEALEEAAKVADQMAIEEDVLADHYRDHTPSPEQREDAMCRAAAHRYAASAIRALKANTPPPREGE